jgi:CrcB protein
VGTRETGQSAVVAAVSAGGMLGAAGRHGVNEWLPTSSGAFPWSTFVVNVTGCLLMGVLLVTIGELRTPHPLARPFLAVGVLGGFTTFSAYAVEVQQLLDAGRLVMALGYLVGTLLTALLAVAAGMRLMRAAARGLAP